MDISVVDCIVTAARDIEKLGVSTFSTTQLASNTKIVIRGSSMLFLARLFILGYPRIIFLQCQRLAGLIVYGLVRLHRLYSSYHISSNLARYDNIRFGAAVYTSTWKIADVNKILFCQGFLPQWRLRWWSQTPNIDGSPTFTEMTVAFAQYRLSPGFVCFISWS